MTAATPQMLRDLGASTDADINSHILADASHRALEGHCVLQYLRENRSLSLRDALVVAFVLNNGLVMCSRGMDEAEHLERTHPPPEPHGPHAGEDAHAGGDAAGEDVHAGMAADIDLRTFEQELDAISDV